MIVDLPDTETSRVNAALIELRKTGGAVALGRVLTLIVAVDELDAETAIVAANDASREHPCRILVLALGNRRSQSRLDAQVRVGGDAGAGEVVVLRLHGRLAEHGESVVVPLLLPDAPVVAWWPSDAPTRPSTDPIGRLANRRITDVGETRRPSRALDDRRRDYTPGDTDMAWTRITNWRAMLAATLDQPPYDVVQSASVTATGDSASGELLAGWLAMMLDCPVSRHRGGSAGVSEVRLERASGTISLTRPDGVNAVLRKPGKAPRTLSLPRRTLAECLAEELRRLDPDEVYAEALTVGTTRVTQGGPRRISPIADNRLDPIRSTRVPGAARTKRTFRDDGSPVTVDDAAAGELPKDWSRMAEPVDGSPGSAADNRAAATRATGRPKATPVTATAAPAAPARTAPVTSTPTRATKTTVTPTRATRTGAGPAGAAAGRTATKAATRARKATP